MLFHLAELCTNSEINNNDNKNISAATWKLNMIHNQQFAVEAARSTVGWSLQSNTSVVQRGCCCLHLNTTQISEQREELWNLSVRYFFQKWSLLVWTWSRAGQRYETYPICGLAKLIKYLNNFMKHFFMKLYVPRQSVHSGHEDENLPVGTGPQTRRSKTVHIQPWNHI